MALLVWFCLGIAIWHFSVFVPDRFRWGIIGALLGATGGAVVTGLLFQLAVGDGLGATSVATVLAAVPGCLLGMAGMYALGARDERELSQG